MRTAAEPKTRGHLAYDEPLRIEIDDEAILTDIYLAAAKEIANTHVATTGGWARIVGSSGQALYGTRPPVKAEGGSMWNATCGDCLGPCSGGEERCSSCDPAQQ